LNKVFVFRIAYCVQVYGIRFTQYTWLYLTEMKHTLLIFVCCFREIRVQRIKEYV